MYLESKDDFASFKNEMQGWYKERKIKKISIKKYIFLTLALLMIFITIGICIN